MPALDNTPAEPELTMREQYALDLAAADTNVQDTFAAVRAEGLTPEQADAAIETYMNARKAQSALLALEKELVTKEEQEKALAGLNKMASQVFKRANGGQGIEPFAYHFTPIMEDGTGGAVLPPKSTPKKSSGAAANGDGASGTGGNARSTVRFTVDGIVFAPPAFMKQFGDEKMDNPNGSKAWENNRTHPKFYASTYVRKLKDGSTISVDAGESPAASHSEFDGWVDHHKARLGWNAVKEATS